MKNRIYKIVPTLSLLFLGMITSAQGGSGGIPTPSGEDDDPVASIDKAIVWLVVAAVVLGAYVMLKQRKAIAK